MFDIQVIVMDFKTTIASESVTENSDGSYTIFINARMSLERQREAYRHALGHIYNGDFESNKSADQIEAERHGRR